MHKISQTWACREEAAVWKESESDPYANLGDPPGEIYLRAVQVLYSLYPLFPFQPVNEQS